MPLTDSERQQLSSLRRAARQVRDASIIDAGESIEIRAVPGEHGYVDIYVQLLRSELPSEVAEFARDRGYLGPGTCPGGVRALGKIVIAIEGDVVMLEPDAVRVNGTVLARSRTVSQDTHGRPLPHRSWGEHRIEPGQVWLFSPYNRDAFDSRYYGPVQASQIVSVLQPVFTQRRVRGPDGWVGDLHRLLAHGGTLSRCRRGCDPMLIDERLRAIAEALPEDGRVSFTRTDLLNMIAADTGPAQSNRQVTVDLTVGEIARLLDRAPGTIRGWCASGELRGAYRLHGREWRVPAAAVEGLQRREAEQRVARRESPTRRVPAQSPDLNAWRSVRSSSPRPGRHHPERVSSVG